MKLILVEWIDACSGYGGWTPREELSHFSVTPNISMGILYEETDKEIKIVPNLNACNLSCPTAIPKVCIKRMRQLKL